MCEGKRKKKKNAVLHTAWQTYAWWLHSLIHMFFPVLCKMGTCAYTYSCVCIHTHTHTRVCMYTYICASKTYLAFLPRLQKKEQKYIDKNSYPSRTHDGISNQIITYQNIIKKKKNVQRSRVCMHDWSDT